MTKLANPFDNGATIWPSSSTPPTCAIILKPPLNAPNSAAASSVAMAGPWSGDRAAKSAGGSVLPMCRSKRTAPCLKRTRTTGRPDGTVTVASSAATPTASVDTTAHGWLPAGKVVVVTAGVVVDVVVVDTVGSVWCAGGDVQAAATMLMRPTAAVIHGLGTMCTTDRGVTRSAYGRLGPLPPQVG